MSNICDKCIHKNDCDDYAEKSEGHTIEWCGDFRTRRHKLVYVCQKCGHEFAKPSRKYYENKTMNRCPIPGCEHPNLDIKDKQPPFKQNSNR